MVRMRRLRSGSSLRDLVRETAVTTNDLVYPVFIKEGKNIKEPVPSMPGIYQYSHDRFDEELERVISAGIRQFLYLVYQNIKMNLEVRHIMIMVLLRI